MNNRWYDKDATVSLAVSLIKNSDKSVQIKCAELITTMAENMGVCRENNLLEAFNYVIMRWYDEEEQLSDAFDYLKKASDETRKQIAIDVIEFLQKADMQKI